MIEPANPFHVLGAGLDPAHLPPVYREVLEAADILVGGSRLLAPWTSLPARRLILKPPLEAVLSEADRLRRQGLKVVVLADGDPGFFGIGARLVRDFGTEAVTFYPNVTVLQAAAARLKLAWEGIEAVSLHGREDLAPLFAALTRERRVGVYTDGRNTPKRIGELMYERTGNDFQMHVFENLGYREERISSHLPSEAVSAEFSDLNFILLERIREPEVELAFGLDDASFVHQGGLVTKKEVRAAGLAALRPAPARVIWDVGAGSGSMAIEAAALSERARVIAIEQDEARAEQIRANARRTGALSVETVCGRAPECLDHLPDPDRVFIGGGLGGDDGILQCVLDRIRPGGRLVIHFVLLQSLQRALALLRDKGLDVELGQVQFSRAQALAGDLRFVPLNPVFILTVQV